MNLLFSRSQMRASFLSLIPLRIGGTVTFKLRAELELTNEELMLARKYSFTKATLIRSDPAEDLANAYRPALFLSIMIAIGIALFVPTSIFGRGVEGILFKSLTVPGLGFASFVVLTVIYFMALRKHVSVDQLTHGGRMFYCHSVVELDEREAEILDISKRFYLTLEKAKNWGGREINPLPDGKPYYLNDPNGSEHQAAIDQAMYKAGAVTKKLLAPFTVSSSDVEPTSGSSPYSNDPRPPTAEQWKRHQEQQTAKKTPPTPSAPNSAPPPSVSPAASHPPATPPSSPQQGKPHPLAPKPPGDEPTGF